MDSWPVRIVGRVAANRPDPAEEWRARASAFGVRVAGFVSQRHLEDWGVSGVMSSSTGIGPEAVVQSASFPRSYTVWRNPEDRADPINLAALSPEMRRMLDRDLPADLPAWLLRSRERMRYPILWEAVQTHWFAGGAEDAEDERSVEELLRGHVDSILRNRYRDELDLGDLHHSRNRADLVPRGTVRADEVTVDGTRRSGVRLDTDPFVVGVGAVLDDGRVVTAVIPRDQLELVKIELVSDAG